MGSITIAQFLLQQQNTVTSTEKKIANIWNNFINKSANEYEIASSGKNKDDKTENIDKNEALIKTFKSLYKGCSFDIVNNKGSNSIVIKVIDNDKVKAEIILGKNRGLQIRENYDSETETFSSVKIYDNEAKVHYVKDGGVWNCEEMSNLSAAGIKAGKTNKVSPSAIAKYLYDDIYAKNNLGLPSTGRKIKQHVKLINKNNVLNVMSNYYNRTGSDKQNLVSAIFHEVGLSAKDRADMVQYIETCLLDYYESLGVYVNDLRLIIQREIRYQRDKFGLMDGSLINKLNNKLAKRWMGKCEDQDMKPADGKVNEISYQGHTGDCWLLASINSIARSPKGREILNNSIEVGKDGTVRVHLKGVNKTYFFTKRELYGSQELSTGDMDIRALEKAVETYMIEENHDDINGDREIIAYKILLGESHLDFGGWDHIWDCVVGIPDSYRDKINDPNTICTASVSEVGKESGLEVAYTTRDGEKIYKNHAYSVVRADEKYVYLINPWDGGKEFRILFKDFKKIFNNFTDVTL